MTRKKWKREVSQFDKPKLVEELKQLRAYWISRSVALGVHPAKPQAKALQEMEQAISRVLESLGEDTVAHPYENIFAER